MTEENFNLKGFLEHQTVRVIFNDNTTRDIILSRAEIYAGYGEKKSYPKGEIIPGKPPQILVFRPDLGADEPIDLNIIQDVIPLNYK